MNHNIYLFTNDEIEYLTLLRNRLKHLAGIIFNEPFLDYESDKRFYILKELYSIYNELYSMRKFQEVYVNKDENLIKHTSFQRELIKMVRNVLLHFPFFDSWNDVYFNKNLILQNVSFNKKNIPNSQINNFFNNPENKGCYVRITEFNGNESNIKILVPKGYNDNDKIFLKDIIEEKYVGKFTVGYIMILLNNFFKRRGLHNLIIPLQEE